MAKEPDNLVLKLLREIRATLDEHTKRFEKADKRFDKVDKKLDDLSESTTYALGISIQKRLEERV